MLSAKRGSPQVVGAPTRLKLSFTVIGTPCSAPQLSPRASAASAAFATCALGLGGTAHAGSMKASRLGVGVPYAHRYEKPEGFDRPIRSSSTRPSFARRSGFSGNSPTRRTESVLRYQTPLGKTGIILRLKVPLKQRKLVKFELRF